MSTPLTPPPTQEEFYEFVSSRVEVISIFATIITAFHESYLKGHRGSDKQKAYLYSTSRIRILDMTLKDMFNSMTYGKR